jgi:hypothetical protein
MQAEWRNVIERMKGASSAAAIVLEGLPSKPTSDISIKGYVAAGREWKSLDNEVSDLRGQIAALAEQPPTTFSVEDDADNLEAALEEGSTALTEITIVLNECLESVEQAKARYQALSMRVEALDQDLQRHKDAVALQRLGSTRAMIVQDVTTCPTCQQYLPDGFDITANPMTPEQSIAYIEEEKRTYRAMQEDSARLVEVEERRLGQVREEAAGYRRRIRSIKEALTSPSSTPSVGQVTERLRARERVEMLGEVQDLLVQTTDELVERAVDWEANRAMLRELAAGGLSDMDEEKLDYMQRSFTEQLYQYRFSSLDPRSVEISSETYRPIHEGFDLGFDLSASDMVRVIWAYLLAILEVGGSYKTNHAGLLIFDEPRQQETDRVSFEALLARAAVAAGETAQIIFATSEEEARLEAMLSKVGHRLISFSERKILAPL